MTGLSLLTDPPPRRAFQWLREVLPPGSRLAAVSPLGGATSSAVHLVEYEDAAGRRRQVVWRRFVRAEWLAEEPDLASREALVLSFLAGSGVRVPALLAVDAEAARCDVPAVIMSFLPGKVVLAPDDIDAWTDSLARALVAIHALAWREAPSMPAWFPFNRSTELVVPSGTHAKGAWQTILEAVATPPPSPEAEVFLHRDYHLGNILWSGGAISSVVDWVNACHGAPEIDVAHCAWNIAALAGADAADRFRGRYESLSRRALNPTWEAWAASDMPAMSAAEDHPPDARQWIGLGGPAITTETLIERGDEFARRTAARLR